ncbi:MAG: hypothetical protein P4M12_11990 [Gammaproteobacteria bacterium]|nr:hypothetical protein [Gammaproteobacteria bacterium]
MSTTRVFNFFNRNLDSYSNLESLINRPVTPVNIDNESEPRLPKDFILQEISQRRDNLDLCETSQQLFENSQYYSVKEAAKQGCTLSEIRAALGPKNNIDITIVNRLMADTSIESSEHVKAVKQTYFLEKMEAYKEPLLMSSLLNISSSPHSQSAQLEKEVTNLLIQYKNVGGKMDNPHLFNVLPMGSAFKLAKQLERNTPPVDSEAQAALSLFR